MINCCYKHTIMSWVFNWQRCMRRYNITYGRNPATCYNTQNRFKVIINTLARCSFVQWISRGYSIILYEPPFHHHISIDADNLIWHGAQCGEALFQARVYRIGSHDPIQSDSRTPFGDRVAECPRTFATFSMCTQLQEILQSQWDACLFGNAMAMSSVLPRHSRNLIRGCRGVKEDVAAMRRPGPHYRQKPSCRL